MNRVRKGYKAKPLVERLADKFLVGDDCWDWIGSTYHDGYGIVCIGSIWDGNRTTRRAHRVIYELLKGPIPEGLVLDHLCRNRKCVRPYHLEPVTQEENLRRSRLARGYSK